MLEVAAALALWSFVHEQDSLLRKRILFSTVWPPGRPSIARTPGNCLKGKIPTRMPTTLSIDERRLV